MHRPWRGGCGVGVTSLGKAVPEQVNNDPTPHQHYSYSSCKRLGSWRVNLNADIVFASYRVCI